MNVTRPALRYFGGKWACAPWILSRFPPHKTYVEPFAGAASVLLRRQRPAPVEVLNDVAGHIVNFFRVVRERHADLVEVLELTPFAAAEHDLAIEPSTDELEMARRFFVRAWMGFGGAPSVKARRGFRRCAYRSLAGEFTGAVANLYAVAERLRNVTIEQGDWSKVIEQYDSPATLFYVDPPYLMRVRAEGRYDKGYGDNEIDAEEHVKLLARLCEVDGQVVVSGYADAMYEDTLSGWERHETIVKGLQNGERTEVLWVRRHRPALGPLFHYTVNGGGGGKPVDMWRKSACWKDSRGCTTSRGRSRRSVPISSACTSRASGCRRAESSRRRSRSARGTCS